MAKFMREWVMSSEQCLREARIDRSLIRFPLQNPNEHITAPENAMQNECQNYLHPVAMRILQQPWTCFPAIQLPTRHLINTSKQLLKF